MIAATARLSSALLQQAYGRNWPAARLHLGLAGLVIATGVYGQWIDARALAALPVGASQVWSNSHAVFGGLLWLSVVARWRWEMQRPLPLADRALVARRLSRLVLLLLYGLAGTREVMELAIYLGRMPDALATSSPAAAISLPGIDSFQVYLAYGIVALLLVRIQAGGPRHAPASAARQESARRDPARWSPAHRRRDPPSSLP